MPLETSFINGTQILQPVVYKQLPFYYNIWFWLGIGLIIFAIIFFVYRNILDRLKNRLVVRVHMPNGHVNHHVFKTFPGVTFSIKGYEKTNEGLTESFLFTFRPECVEKGRYGNYIDYDYGNPEPIFPVKRIYDRSEHFQIFKMLSALVNSEILTNLLLSKEFKEFVKMMLWIIVIEGIIILGAVILMSLLNKPAPVSCLSYNNQTLMFLRQALRSMPVSIPIE